MNLKIMSITLLIFVRKAINMAFWVLGRIPHFCNPEVEQTVGQLFLKSWKPDEDPVEMFIWRFQKKRMKSKNTIIIDGEAWTMKPTSCVTSKYVNQCPFCKENFVVKKTMIIPCERRHKTKWICFKHSFTPRNKEAWSPPAKQGKWVFIEELMYGVWMRDKAV